METNALLAEWTDPYGGVPAFDRMDLNDLKPALETGMEWGLADIDAIANSTEAPLDQDARWEKYRPLTP